MWKNLLRELIKKVAIEDKPLCLVLEEGQLFEPEEMIIDLSSLLRTGSITDLYTKNEM
jgi:hypothetical protein